MQLNTVQIMAKSYRDLKNLIYCRRVREKIRFPLINISCWYTMRCKAITKTNVLMSVIKLKCRKFFVFTLQVWIMTSWEKFPLEIVWIEIEKSNHEGQVKTTTTQMNPTNPGERSTSKRELNKIPSLWRYFVVFVKEMCLQVAGFMLIEEGVRLTILGRSLQCFKNTTYQVSV